MSLRVRGFSVTVKPWGKEILVEHTSKYALKEIRMARGTRSSLQSHDEKLETVFVESGKIKLETIADDGHCFEVFAQNEAYTVPPGVKHRVTVLEDCRLIEVSTPELDDLVRYQDDYDRS